MVYFGGFLEDEANKLRSLNNTSVFYAKMCVYISSDLAAELLLILHGKHVLTTSHIRAKLKSKHS